MKKYHKTLPLATGYFGVSSALYAFGGLVVVYGPAGGAWHINIEDEPRWYRGPATVVGAGLLEMDVILGNDDKFIDNIARVANGLKRGFVCLAGTPISEIIGTDLKGFARTLEGRASIPVFMVPTAGSEPYPEGASKAFLALADKLMAPAASKHPKGVNVLGAIHLSTGREERLEPLLAAIERAGFTLLGVLSSPRPGVADPLEGLRRAPAAERNAVISTSGLALAEHMYAAYGIPYVLGLPVGLRGRDDFLALLRGEQPGPAPAVTRPAAFRHALVVGEPVLGYGVQRCLRHDFGVPRVDVVSVVPSEMLFKGSEACSGTLIERGPADVDTESEQDIAALMNDPDVDCIVADPCYQALLTREVKFIRLPHIAMSARMYWDLPYEYAVDKGHEYLGAQLFGPGQG
ncbi:MAG: nitrogenase component 1 [Desulfovibrionaceae bacterium]|nr:nitrogenase component 1 [Desulfovibrionaceae bacterium]